MEYIRSHPGEFAGKTWNRILDTWLAVDDSFDDHWIASLHLMGENIFLCSVFSLLSRRTPFGLAGKWDRSASSGDLPHLVSRSVLHFACRNALRHPIDPLLAVLTAYAVSRAWENVTRGPIVENLQTSPTV